MPPRLALSVVGMLLLGGTLAWRVYRADDSLDAVHVTRARFSVSMHDERELAEIALDGGPDVYHHVLLSAVPLGKKLELRCEWRSPDGQLARVNEYRTHLTDKAEWPTHCHQRFTAVDGLGVWTVTLRLAGRVVNTSQLTLR